MEEAMRSRKLVSFMFGAMMAMAAVTGCGKQGTPAAGTSVQASESVSHTEQAAEAENGDTEAGRNRAIWWRRSSWREGRTGELPALI